MIVDDEPYNIMALKIIIDHSHENDLNGIIDVANNGLQALNLVKDAFKS
jgi:YesN/AraC family two-component response regulator